MDPLNLALTIIGVVVVVSIIIALVRAVIKAAFIITSLYALGVVLTVLINTVHNVAMFQDAFLSWAAVAQRVLEALCS